MAKDSVFLYTASGLGVSSFTGTGTEFNNVSAGLAKVWEMVNKELKPSSQKLVRLLYCSADCMLIAKLSNGSTYTTYGARFHGEISSYDAGAELLERIRLQVR